MTSVWNAPINMAQPWRPTYASWIPPEVWQRHEDYIRGLQAAGVSDERMVAILDSSRDFHPSPDQLSRQLRIWGLRSPRTRVDRASRSDSDTDKEVYYGPSWASPPIPENEVSRPMGVMENIHRQPNARNSFASSISGSYSYGVASPDRQSTRPVSSIGLEDERYESTSVVSWTVDSRSEINSLHPSSPSMQSFPVARRTDTVHPLQSMLRRELDTPTPRSSSFLAGIARDTLGIHHVETRTSDRLLQFAVLLSKGGLISFGASLYHFLLLRECETLHGVDFLVRLALRYLSSGQTHLGPAKIGRIAFKLIEHLLRDRNSHRSRRLAEVLAAFLLSTPVRIEAGHKLDYLISMATHAVTVSNWKTLMENDLVGIKDFLDIETRISGLQTGSPSTGDSAQSDVWQKGSFRVYMTRSGTSHLRTLVEWALQPVEDQVYYRRIGDYSKQSKSKQMFQATYLSLFYRLITDPSRYHQPFDPHLTINTRDTTFRLNEYESLAIISYLLVNIKALVSLMCRTDSDEYLSAASVRPFFDKQELFEETMHSTLKNYFSNRDSASTSPRDGADAFILSLVKRVANHNKDWQSIIYPTTTPGSTYVQGSGHTHDSRQNSLSNLATVANSNPQPNVELMSEPDMMVVPVVPLERQPSKGELPTRSMSRSQVQPIISQHQQRR